MTSSNAAGSAEARRLRAGCYLFRYQPLVADEISDPPLVIGHYDGTFRVHRAADDRVSASGDLYYHTPPPSEDPFDPAWFEPNPGQGVPVFSRDAYRYHVRVLTLREPAPGRPHLGLRFEMRKYHAAFNLWENLGCFSARLRWTAAPRGYPAPGDFLTGEARDCSGTVIGFFTMGWVSDALRRALVEIDRVSDSELPLDNGAGVDWRTLFAQVPWQFEVERGDDAVPQPHDESWSDGELHAAMEHWRDPEASLDRQWRFHLLCVHRVDSNERGVMYDHNAADSNHVPREGAAIASHWVIEDKPHWGRVRNVRFGLASAPYFRASVHEIGHAFSLGHNKTGPHVMRPTEDIAMDARAPVEFPDNIAWSFSPADMEWLRHAPDLVVRPGGVASFGSFLDRGGRRAEGLVLEVSALLDDVPLGAPVRVHAVLRNAGKKPVAAPASLSLRSGCVRGRVYDAARTARAFLPLVLCTDGRRLAELPPGGRVESSFTLWRGPQGALFPAPGAYQVEVRAEWDDGDESVMVLGRCAVTVTPARDTDHAAAARAVLENPEALLTLVLGGDHLPEAQAAIRAAMANDVLRPHWAVIEARRLARRFRDRPADFAAVRALLDASAVAAPSEIRRLSLLAQAGPADQAEPRAEVVRLMKRRAAQLTGGRDLVRFLDEA